MKFIEIGASHYGFLTKLLYPDWKERYPHHKLPRSIFEMDGEWEGWFVEPVAGCLSRLIEQNIDLPNAHFISGLLAGSTEFKEVPVYLHKGQNAPEMAGMYYSETKRLRYQFMIQSFTLDDLLDSLQIHPDLIHIDIEGFEREVFENYRWTCAPKYWMIDAHNDRENIKFFINLFQSRDYRVLTQTGGDDMAEIWFEQR